MPSTERFHLALPKVERTKEYTRRKVKGKTKEMRTVKVRENTVYSSFLHFIPSFGGGQFGSGVGGALLGVPLVGDLAFGA